MKIAGLKVNRMTSNEIEDQDREIKESQHKYQDIMIIVNQLKRRAFLHKQESIAPFVTQKNKEISKLMNLNNKLKVKFD